MGESKRTKQYREENVIIDDVDTEAKRQQRADTRAKLAAARSPKTASIGIRTPANWTRVPPRKKEPKKGPSYVYRRPDAESSPRLQKVEA